MEEKYITLRGARTNNLDNIDLDIPRGKITAIVGVSGAGKSSLVFETIYAESYLRYIESISPYVRQFLDKMEKPKLDSLEGLPPAISIKHRKPAKNARSLVATSLDIYDYLRILFAKISDFSCPQCGVPIRKYSIDEILDSLYEDFTGTVDVVFEYSGDVAFLVNRGYYYYIETGERRRIDHKVKDRLIHVLIDRVEISEPNRGRIFEALDKSISLGTGNAILFYRGGKKTFPSILYCPHCDIQYPDPDENLFSFNSPRGACEYCNGFGDVQELDRNLIFDPNLSLEQGGVKPFNTPTNRRRFIKLLEQALVKGIPLDIPIKDLRPGAMDFLMNGSGRYKGINGYFSTMKRKSYKVQARVAVSRYSTYKPCPHCQGKRLNPGALAFTIKGKSIADVIALTIEQALDFIKSLDWDTYNKRVSSQVFQDIENRFRFLVESGLSYIELNRSSHTLSRGEFQRINLAFILGSTLSDSLLIIDQPSADLHPLDYEKLEKFLIDLKNNNNTVLLVEHNRDVVEKADHIIELGPLSGIKGGKVVFTGSRDSFFQSRETVTQQSFSKEIPPGVSSKQFPHLIEFPGAKSHNLKGFKYKIPLEGLTVVAGVSGAGKTTLLYHEIYRHWLNKTADIPVKEALFIDPGLERPRASSIAAGFFDFFPAVRDLLAAGKESRLLGYTAGHFSFNSPLGRCPVCKGLGYAEIEMQFLPPVKITCRQCGGSKYNPEVLKIQYKGNNIAKILEMDVNQFFELAGENLTPKIREILTNIKENGLGYIQLGQGLKTFSDGELQRMKLVKYLNLAKKETLFLIDEPCFGLHEQDVESILKLFARILANSNTIIVAEHNPRLLTACDWLLELGYGGGNRGGHLIYQGPLPGIFKKGQSPTAEYLKKKLKIT